MHPHVWLIIGLACGIVFLQLILYAWTQRHTDHFLRRFFRKKKPLPPVLNITTCDNCRQGIAEISQTSITGSWTCPVCGDFHCFVDGQPGRIEP